MLWDTPEQTFMVGRAGTHGFRPHGAKMSAHKPLMVQCGFSASFHRHMGEGVRMGGTWFPGALIPLSLCWKGPWSLNRWVLKTRVHQPLLLPPAPDSRVHLHLDCGVTLISGT